MMTCLNLHFRVGIIDLDWCEGWLRVSLLYVEPLSLVLWFYEMRGYLILVVDGFRRLRVYPGEGSAW